MSKQMTGAEMVVAALKDQGVDTIFGYPGGAVLPIYDALFQQNFVKHILVRHEQGAVHAAEGYARSTGKVGVRARHLRSRRDQRRHRPHRRADGFHSAGLHHRAGADASDRLGRLPGMRHGRHHAPLHQAQLSREARSRICRASCTRRSMSRARPPRSGRDRHSQGHPVRQRRYYRPRRTSQHKTYQPQPQGRHGRRSRQPSR